MIDKKNNVFVIFLIMIICTIFTATGQYFWKVGSNNIVDIYTFLFNLPVIIGFICYGFGFVLYSFALKFGELSITFPLLSMSFVWAVLFSILFLEEQLTQFMILGLTLIICGVVLIGRGVNYEC